MKMDRRTKEWKEHIEHQWNQVRAFMACYDNQHNPSLARRALSNPPVLKQVNDRWWESKKHLINLFGGLRMELPIIPKPDDSEEDISQEGGRDPSEDEREHFKRQIIHSWEHCSSANSWTAKWNDTHRDNLPHEVLMKCKTELATQMAKAHGVHSQLDGVNTLVTSLSFSHLWHNIWSPCVSLRYDFTQREGWGHFNERSVRAYIKIPQEWKDQMAGVWGYGDISDQPDWCNQDRPSHNWNLLNILLCFVSTIPWTALTENKVHSGGMKINKYFKQLIPNIEEFIAEPMPDGTIKWHSLHEWFDIDWSMLLQNIRARSNKEEKIVVSVEPIEFLLQAQANGFSSCHALCGCHASGVWGYMFDPNTAVSVKPNGELYKQYTWQGKTYTYPNKSWRQVVHIDHENYSAVLGRQYPNNKEMFARTVRHGLMHKMAEKAGVKASWLLKRNSNGIYDMFENHVYPDTRHSGFCQRIILKEVGSLPKYQVGVEYIPCIVCGGTDLSRGPTPYCSNCRQASGDMLIHDDDYFMCVYCEEEHHEDVRCNTPDGDPVCETCWDEHFTFCNGCSGEMSREDSFEVMGFSMSGRLRDQQFCEHCRDTYAERCEECGTYYRNGECATEWLRGMDDGDVYCVSCLDEYHDGWGECHECGNTCYKLQYIDGLPDDENLYCEDCADEIYAEIAQEIEEDPEKEQWRDDNLRYEFENRMKNYRHVAPHVVFRGHQSEEEEAI